MLKVSRVVTYSSDLYLEYCKEENVTPSKEHFLWFIQDDLDEDFSSSYDCQDVELIC